MTGSPRTIDVAERRARLVRRHRLLAEERTDDVPAIADSVVALHSTDPVTVHLSATARMRTPSVEAVERALYVDREVLRHHAMRRTLWVATPDVARCMHAAATRRLIGPEHRRTARMLAENGIEDPETWLVDARRRVLATLREHGPMTARSLGQQVPELRHEIVLARGKRYEGMASAHTRVLLNLGFEGAILRARPTGTWINGAYTYVSADAWLEGGLGDLGEQEGARDLALRWLHAFGPGTATDLQWWMGWTVATTRRALADCGAVEVRVDGGAAFVAPDDVDPVAPVAPCVAVLPGLDPTTMGWKQRGWYLPDACADVFDRMGNAGPTLWVDGVVVGGWVQSSTGEIRTRLLVDVPADRVAALDERIAAVAAVVGETRFRVRFPSPVSTALLLG